MQTAHQIDQILQENLPAIVSGQETIESILEKHPDIADELRPQLEAVLWLQQTKKLIEPRSGYIVATRKYVEEQVQSMQPLTLWQRLLRQHAPQKWVFNIATVALLIISLVAVVNNLFLTARLAIPGDPLYSVKLAMEDTQLGLTFNPAAKTDLYIEFSRERTTEIVDLILEGDYERLPASARRLETEIIAALHSLGDISEHDPAQEQAMLNNLRETLSSEIFMLNVMKGTSPASALPGIELAIHAAQSGLLALR